MVHGALWTKDVVDGRNRFKFLGNVSVVEVDGYKKKVVNVIINRGRLADILKIRRIVDNNTKSS